jgi:hypothetical protein
VTDSMSLQVSVKLLISEVCPSVTNNHPCIPNLGNIISSNIFFECLESAFMHGIASTYLDT